jgi:hypothetical protein
MATHGQSPLLAALDEEIAACSSDRLPLLIVALTARVSTATARLLGRQETKSSGKTTDENLPVREAARRLGVSPSYLYRHFAKLPFGVRIGRRKLFSARGLERWNRQRQGQAS